ncbi:hypothetical protein [Clostridium estertheticum]|uniref:hypothetical protein n=1 Tax=Clostridium estertheticum TaxID=238834 RepID=UPI001C6EAFCC|nr:hypothetical protein [Clostridium estertheticum]MBW9150727.1 hypothetical protein [Clostridium estertheticum]WLC84539.1 hypothetical protein KTC97_01640 [Clostridium estertheticum]
MKSKKLWVALTLSLVLITSGVVFATETSTTTPITTAGHKALGMARATGLRGYDYITSVLKTKGFTDTQITAGLASGKTVYELAKEKGMSEEQFKAALLAEKSKAIDASVTKGTITKEEGATLKENIKTNAASCTGNFGEGNKNSNGAGNVHGINKTHGNGGGMMGNGKGVSK